METVETILYQPIELPCWDLIRANAFTAINWSPEDNEYRVYHVPVNKFDPAILKQLEQQVSAFIDKDVAVREALIFQSRPNENPPIHLDGNDLDKTTSHVALNIPLLNCEGSFMHWYAGEYQKELFHSPSNPNVYSIGLGWSKGPNEIFFQEITTPSLVRVDVPHRVVNQQPRKRIILSMRFDPDLEFSSRHPSYGI